MKQKIFALGFCDGVHVGHQALLAACCRMAEKRAAMACAHTFDLPPSAVLQNLQPNMINTCDDRRKLLHAYGIGPIYIDGTTREGLCRTWEEFLEELVSYGAVGFVCGADYRFGKNGAGNAEKLAEFAEKRGFLWEIVPEQKMDGEKISSTRIRECLETGDLQKANQLLGHPHMLTGAVVPGQKLGRTIGSPTANLHLPEELLTPAFGVYACTTELDGKKYVAVTNIGKRPTVDGQNVTVEPWILDYSGDLYGREITLHFHKFLRPERKFSGLGELKMQIQEDAAAALRLLRYKEYS